MLCYVRMFHDVRALLGVWRLLSTLASFMMVGFALRRARGVVIRPLDTVDASAIREKERKQSSRKSCKVCKVWMNLSFRRIISQ